jgi:HPt (histidine-containing phosphotransfer) domain-containing protein
MSRDDLQPRAGVPAPPPIDIDSLFERLGGDAELVVEVARLFLEDCPTQLASIAAAIDLRDAVRIRVAAHTLKGAAANLSATGLQQAAAHLEQLAAESRLDAAAACWQTLMREASAASQALRALPGVCDSRGRGDEACER